jgi:hypothetical protein
MAYVTESIKDRDEVWLITLLAHIFVVIFLLPLYSHRFTSVFSGKVISVLNFLFGKSKAINLEKIEKKHKVDSRVLPGTISLILTSYIAGFLFSFSITFLYYFSFFYPQKALILSSVTQVINMFGSLLLVLFIDPRIMGAIDDGQGYNEIRVLTSTRIFVHITLILILFIIQ